VPEKEHAALDAALREAGASAGRPARETVLRLQQFFNGSFQYSLDLASGQQNATPLADFLLRTRTGHCEYFATAGALLLRRAGVPARYTVGFSSYEYSDLEGGFPRALTGFPCLGVVWRTEPGRSSIRRRRRG